MKPMPRAVRLFLLLLPVALVLDETAICDVQQLGALIDHDVAQRFKGARQAQQLF